MQEIVAHPTKILRGRFAVLFSTILLLLTVFLVGVYSGTSGFHRAFFDQYSKPIASFDVDGEIRRNKGHSLSEALEEFVGKLQEHKEYSNNSLGRTSELIQDSVARNKHFQDIFVGLENSLKSSNYLKIQ